MSNVTTATIGIQIVRKEIAIRGGDEIVIRKEGNKQFIDFRAPNGRCYRVTTRAKRSGTWQTMTTYGQQQHENLQEDQFWIFVDLGFDPPKFYPVPFWWISNDIYRAHEEYLKKHGDHRARNDNSIHHAVQLKRIKSWEGQWQNLSL